MKNIKKINKKGNLNILQSSVLSLIVMGLTIVFGLIIMGGVATSVQTTTESTENFTTIYDTAVSLSATDWVVGSDSVSCDTNTLIRSTDYTPDSGSGTIEIISYPRAVANGTFTSDHDANVTLNIGNFSNVSSATVHNCTDFDEVWETTGNYTFYEIDANITILSTGNMSDATDYCINYTFSLAQDNATCLAGYSYYDNPAEYNATEDMIDAISVIPENGTTLVWVILGGVLISIMVFLFTRIKNKGSA